MQLQPLMCVILAALSLAVSVDVAYAATPPGPAHQGRVQEEWHDPDDPHATGVYEVTIPPDDDDDYTWGWYQKYPPYARHPSDPTPRPNGRLQMTGGGSAHAESDHEVLVNFTLTAVQDPAGPTVLNVYWGDGTSESTTVPQGSGSVTISLPHYYYGESPGAVHNYPASA